MLYPAFLKMLAFRLYGTVWNTYMHAMLEINIYMTCIAPACMYASLSGWWLCLQNLGQHFFPVGKTVRQIPPHRNLLSNKCDIAARPCTLAHLVLFVWKQNFPTLGLFFGGLDTNSVASSWFSFTWLTYSTVSMCPSISRPDPTVAKRLNDWQEDSLGPFISP